MQFIMIETFRLSIVHIVCIILGAIPSSLLFAGNAPQEMDDKATAKRTITLQGTMDTRLFANLVTVYRPTRFDNKEECLTKHAIPTTGRRKGLLDWEVVRLEPDAHGYFKASVPIDYIGKFKCGYEYAGTYLRVRRDQKDGLYAKIYIADDNNRPFHVYQGRPTGQGGYTPDAPRFPGNDKRYYQLSSGSRITCFTKYYDGSKNVAFICYPAYGHETNGVDEFSTVTIDIDIDIDESKCLFVYSYNDIPNRGRKDKDYYRDYVEKPTTFLERVQNGIKNLLN